MKVRKMTEYKTKNYRLTIDESGEINIYSISQLKPIQKALVNGQWVETKPDQGLENLAREMSKYPALRAVHTGDNMFEIDLDCGMQRFIGPKPASDIRKFIMASGFDRPTMIKIMREAKSQEHSGVTRVC